MDHMQPVVMDPAAQKTNEVGIGLERDQYRVRAHPAKDLGGEGAHPRSVLQKHPPPNPVHFTQYLVDQKAGAGNQASEHFRMLDEIASEEQELLRTRGALCGHGIESAFQEWSCPPTCRAPE